MPELRPTSGTVTADPWAPEPERSITSPATVTVAVDDTTLPFESLYEYGIGGVTPEYPVAGVKVTWPVAES